MKSIVFVANNNVGSGLSGGDTIFTQLIKSWQVKLDITLVGSEEAIIIAKREGVSDITFIQLDSKNKDSNYQSTWGEIKHTLRRSLMAVISLAANWKTFKQADYVYNVSDFYPDFVPAFLVKIFCPKVKWLCGYYLIAPSPWNKSSPYRQKSPLKGFFYWLMQRPTFLLTKVFADKILVTSEDEKNKFISAGTKQDKLVVVRGGVDIQPSENFLNSSKVIPINKRVYDACFVGRFHEQKGVVGLIDIWKNVVDQKQEAKLAMIGDGALMSVVKNKINNLDLNDNIELLGFQIGQKKFDVFKNSKIILHPATFDSGGMAAAEGMAWQLPAVGYDLDSLKTYYPQGMLKADLNDQKDFADKIIKLLSNKKLYTKVSQQAYQLIINYWDWKKRSEEIFNQIFND
jgi:glycosyltransferase involved in cell wall biosynthesis